MIDPARAVDALVRAMTAPVDGHVFQEGVPLPGDYFEKGYTCSCGCWDSRHDEGWLEHVSAAQEREAAAALERAGGT